MQYILVVILLFIGVVESSRRGKLTISGAITGGVIGFFIFVGGGWLGLAFLSTFFLLGTMATSWQRKQKSGSGMAQESEGKRNTGQVIANSGVAGLAGLMTLFFPDKKDLITLLIAGAFSSALADTLSSELGTVYGKRFFNILTLKQDKKGLDGVVSVEGTLIGLAGSVLIALICCIGFGWGQHFYWIIIAGTAGNLADSLLGAALERKGMIKNDTVNLANTLIAALVIWLTV